MKVHAGVEPHDPEQLARLSVTNAKPYGAPRVPVRGACLRIPLTGLRRVVEGNPREPALEVPPGLIDGVPELGAVGGFDREEDAARGFDRSAAHGGARGN